MSWDVMILNIKGAKPPPLELLQQSDCAPLGSLRDVRVQLASLLSGIDWQVPTRGVYDGDGFSIEFNTGEDDPVSSIMLHVRGGGDAIADIVKFARPLGWSALDCSTSEFLDLEDPSHAGWEGFQSYRDRVMGEIRRDGGSG